LAFVIGFLFGPIGVAIYFRSWMELLNCLAMVIVAAIIVPGIGALAGWLGSAIYAGYRAHTSNKKAGY
jgi:hypothetical protein